ncbi:hypothetical protein BpHYR1_022075 [Brachionus plicatilis]|uniref:Uncharacterized protein n=1 Tax=Brachionus plicatilis TaxID=10195 RepID=A0A3M7QIH7_BRAPC|nr:hypothetical protein BpHYR1_022075 [Brachionus plicatilis]
MGNGSDVAQSDGDNKLRLAKFIHPFEGSFARVVECVQLFADLVLKNLFEHILFKYKKYKLRKNAA